jgi:ParB-like chromosome segregation protein Spo0J
MSKNHERVAIEAEQVPISELRPYERNPRRGDVEAIKESLEVNGQYRPIVVNKRDNTVVAGNHTLAAAKKLDWETIAVTFVDALRFGGGHRPVLVSLTRLG